MDVLYLDFDGVGHPADVWFDTVSKQVSLRAPGHVLFESMPVLEAAIVPYPDLKIVLSTKWVATFGFEYAKACLSEALQRRVIGATYDPLSPEAWRFGRLKRYDAIALDVARRQPHRHLAVDDDALGWPENEREALVLVPAKIGLQCPAAQSLLNARLAARFP
jgi:hypothetical protein